MRGRRNPIFAAETFVAPRTISNETVSEVEGVRVAAVEDDGPIRRALTFQPGIAGFQAATYTSAEKFFEAAASVISRRVDGFDIKLHPNRLMR